MKFGLSHAIVSCIAVISLLIVPAAYAVVTVPVTNAAGDPVASQTITLQFPSGKTREAVTNAQGEVTLAEDEEDEDGMLLLFLPDGTQLSSYQLTGATAAAAGVPAWQWVVGGLVAAGGIAAATDSSGSSGSDGTDSGGSDSGGGSGGGSGGSGGSSGNVLSATCEIGISQIIGGAAPDDPDLVGQATVGVDLDGRDVTLDYSGLISGTITAFCDNEDDLGPSFCAQTGGSLTIDGVPGTQTGGGYFFNEAGDGLNYHGAQIDFDFEGGTATANFEGPCTSD